MKEGPEFRIIGNAPEEEKEKAEEELRGLLFEHLESLPPKAQENIEKYEYPKTEKELALIGFANKETSRLMKEVGVKPYEIPDENYHIVPREEFETISEGGAVATTFWDKQAMVYDAKSVRRTTPVFLGSVMFHETLHLKGHLTLELRKEDEINKDKEGKKVRRTLYRAGVSIKALQKQEREGKYHEHFLGLHEAIIAAQTKKSFSRLLEAPELSEERKWLMSDEARQIKQRIVKERARERQTSEIPEDEFVWVGRDGKDWEVFSYREQRQVLDYVCQEIKKQFPEQYRSPDDVFKEFLKAHFTGHLLPIGRLVERTFGEGSFRMLGNMTTERQSGVLHLESLQRARARQTKESKR